MAKYVYLLLGIIILIEDLHLIINYRSGIEHIDAADSKGIEVTEKGKRALILRQKVIIVSVSIGAATIIIKALSMW